MDQDNQVSTNVIQKNIEAISFFEKDADFIFVYKKTEKLASAIYMVTNLFSESESMKWSLRKKVSDLLSLTITYKDTSESTRRDFINSAATKILELISFLEICLHGGLISKMNFSVLKQEFSNVLEALHSSNNVSKDLFQNSLTNSFFETSKDSETTLGGSISLPHPHAPETSSLERKAEDIKDKERVITKDELKRSNRQSIILNLLRKKKELTIKDIVMVIKDCSEKTIQRELNSFIVSGIVKRTGVRRWSKYSMVSR